MIRIISKKNRVISMKKNSVNKFGLILFAFILSFFAVSTHAKTPATPYTAVQNDLSAQSENRFWRVFEVKNNTEIKPKEKYTSISSTYLVYPEKHKNKDITSLKLKNKSLSLSIPIQYRKTEPDIFQNEEKKIIKHLSVYSY